MHNMLKELRRDKLAVIALVLLGVIFLMAIVGPYLAPFDPITQNLHERRLGPSLVHWLGTDEFGRDILSRLIFGSRNTLFIGFLSVAIGLSIGCVLGVIAGYYGGFADSCIMRAMDLMLAYPYFLLALLIVATLGPGMTNSTIAIGIASVPTYSRVVRSSVMALKGSLLVKAEEALGATDWRIIILHVAPNVFAPVIVVATLGVASAVLGGAALGFLGLGAQPPTPEWGVMLSGGRSYLIDAPHIALAPGIALALLVVSCNLFGDTLRDILDPKLK